MNLLQKVRRFLKHGVVYAFFVYSLVIIVTLISKMDCLLRLVAEMTCV